MTTSRTRKRILVYTWRLSNLLTQSEPAPFAKDYVTNSDVIHDVMKYEEKTEWV